MNIPAISAGRSLEIYAGAAAVMDGSVLPGLFKAAGKDEAAIHAERAAIKSANRRPSI